MEPTSQGPLLRFLQRVLQRSNLTPEEQRALLALSGKPEKYAAHEDIVSPGEHVDGACLVARGLAGRFDQMLDGRRQVTSFYIPGDMCDLHSVVAPKASWSITAVSPVTVFRIPHRELRDLCARYPAVAMAFWRDGTVDSSIFAKWVGNLGRKNAKAKVAHIFCEMGLRMEAAGLGSRTSFQLNATQERLADAAGMTAVHVNRMLQEIRGEGVLTFQSGHVEVLDWNALTSIAEFDPAYLMLDVPPHRAVPAAAPQAAFVH